MPRSNVQEGTEDKAGALLFVRAFEPDTSDGTRVGAGSSPAPTEKRLVSSSYLRKKVFRFAAPCAAWNR
jgi:hypothetical protein